MYEFRLFIVGQTPRSAKVVEDLKKLLEDALKDQYSFEVIDVIESPELAEKAKILATPTLVKVAPEPVRRIIGDLSDTETVLSALGLTPQEENKQ